MVNKQNYTLCFLRTGGNGSRPRSVNIRGLTMDRGHSNSAWLSGRKVKGSVHPNHEKNKCHVPLTCASKSRKKKKKRNKQQNIFGEKLCPSYFR